MKHTHDLTLILSCEQMPAPQTLADYKQACGQLIVIYPTYEEATSLPDTVTGIARHPENGKVAALNKAVGRAKGSHILWMEAGEVLPEIPALEAHRYYTARISHTQTTAPVHNWQVRLFPNPKDDEEIFTGFEIPEMYSAAHRLNWELSAHHLTIERTAPLFPSAAVKREANSETDSVMGSFWQGIWAAENQDYNTAIRSFKKTLGKEQLAPWNKLAALNSLANALMEVHRPDEAKRIAEKSLRVTSDQWAPYLTLYQYYNVTGRKPLAYQNLSMYLQAMQKITEANFDVYLPPSDAVFLLGEIAAGQGRHRQAYAHYQQFYDYNAGKLSTALLEKLLIYAIQLDDRPKAIEYFKARFGDDFSGTLSKNKSARILEALSLFADNEWYEFPSTIYRQLVTLHPEDEALRNGCIRTLIKNNQIEKAQALL